MLLIRVKQLATESSQNLLNKKIIEEFEDKKDISGEFFVKQIKENLSKWFELVKEVNAKFSPPEELDKVGFPIKCNKTAIQLKMALDWLNNLEQENIDIMQNLKNSTFYNGLNNKVESDKLPILQQPSDSALWGNENPSVSTVLLYSIANTMNIPKVEPAGATTFYPFF